MGFAKYGSVVVPFLANVWERPDGRALVFIGDDDSETVISYSQFHQMAAVYAALFREKGVGAGDVIFIALPHSLDLPAAFWGALYVGAIPSIFPYPVPRPENEVFFEQIGRLVDEAGAAAVVVAADLAEELCRRLAGRGCASLGSLSVAVCKGDAYGYPLTDLPDVVPGGERTAYLQYTGGASGMEKGVMLSHRAILNFVEQFSRALTITADDVLVNWMPLYHDFGLFGGLALPFCFGIPLVLMSPFKWTKRPLKLFQAIERHGGTLCWMTNSAQTHAVRGIPDPAGSGLDLSSLRMLFNGAAPINYRTQQQFLDHFAPCCFRESALAAGYGMAENTLTVSVTPPGRPPRVDWASVSELKAGRAVTMAAGSAGSQPVVSCGQIVWGAKAMIAAEDGGPLPERRVGEVAIRTNSLFSGYMGRPELTAEVLRDGWFYTGDLGYLAEGELFICGRKKELIIVGGENIYPEDF